MKRFEGSTGGEVSRREFLEAAAGAGAMLAIAPEIAAAKSKKKAWQKRTLFFNLSHESYSGHEYHILLGKSRHRLKEIGRGDGVVSRVRRTNKFLAGVPDGSITHVIESVELPADEVMLSYTIKDPVMGTGEWQMSSLFLMPPLSSLAYAYEQARLTLDALQPLRLSAKRKKYGLAPAMTFQDLLDEQVLLDTTDWATALVNLHPEMLSADPDSAAHIQTNHITHLSSTYQLSEVLGGAGPAAPQVAAGTDNSSGWATLIPYTDTDGTPLVNDKGNNKGLILYDPKWQAGLRPFVAAPMITAMRTVKDAPSLGLDVTGKSTNDATGVIWTRNDGQGSIDQSAAALSGKGSSNAKYTLSNITPIFNGYSCTASTTFDGSDAVVTLTFSNWYLRYLGLYIQFLKTGGAVVPVSELPPGIIPGNGDFTANNELLMGSLTPEFTIYGIPILAGSNSVTFTFPAQNASTAKILASGLGTGSHIAQDTEVLGIVMTTLFNLILPAGLLALGVGTSIDVFVKTLAFPAALFVAKEIAVAAPDGHSSQIAGIFWKSFVKGAITPALKAFLVNFIAFLGGAEATGAVEDSIPIAGEIIQAIGIFGTIEELTETTAETTTSPWTYVYDLVGTYDLDLKILPDPKDALGFPAAAATYTATAIFDNGTPQTLNLPVPSGAKSLTPTFKDVPLGGSVTLTTGFYTAGGTNVGHGTTGSIPNVLGTNAVITITEVQLPITGSTVYEHKQKTSLDSAGNHLWICSAAPPAPVSQSNCGTAEGDICSFRNITFNPTLGQIGYGWQSFSKSGCDPGSEAQLYQLASIGGANSGANAQSSYAGLNCSLPGSASIIYDPLGRPDLNFYVDTSANTNLLRNITLGPTVFSDPRGNQAWGKFTLAPDDLLLHPSGSVISINQTASRLESLKIPAASMSDADAAIQLQASLHGGLGSRPGLFDQPTVAAVTSDGVILVLETGNNRIHAVDASGNPVRHFTAQPEPYFLTLTQTGGSNTTYMDMAVEFSGLIYILSYSAGVYRLDIYRPDQTGGAPLSTTRNFHAAKVTVDYWRNVYSLNYEVLLQNGAFPANGVTEPSISQWIPTAPPPCDGVSEAPPTGSANKGRKKHTRLLRRRDLWTGFSGGLVQS